MCLRMIVKAAGQVGEGALELVGVLRAVERAAGGLGDLSERGIVDGEAGCRRRRTRRRPAAGRRRRTRRTASCRTPSGRGVSGAEADGEDADAAGGRLPRRGLRVDALVVRAVGEHDDHVVGVAGAAVAGSRSHRSARPTGRPARWRRARSGCPAPIAVPSEVVRPPSALSSCVGVGRWAGRGRPAVPAKATRPMRGPPAWDLMKALAAFLGGGDPVRVRRPWSTWSPRRPARA